MTPEQIHLVQSSWQKVVPIREVAAELFYGRLFELDPELKPLFNGDMPAQGRKLMTMLGTAVAGLTNLAAIVPTVQDLGRRHVGYGVKDADYATVGSALLWTLQQGLAEEFTPQVREAWSAAYTILANTMREAAAASRAA